MKTKTGTVLATAAAAAFLMAAPLTSGTAQAGDMVKCVGGNSCKGHSACKTANSSCKGLNACKGQGFTMAESKEACTKAGGKAES